MSGAVTGEVHFVDCGYNTVSMPNLQSLKEIDSESKARPAVRRRKQRSKAFPSRLSILQQAVRIVCDGGLFRWHLTGVARDWP